MDKLLLECMACSRFRPERQVVACMRVKAVTFRKRRGLSFHGCMDELGIRSGRYWHYLHNWYGKYEAIGSKSSTDLRCVVSFMYYRFSISSCS